MDTKKLYKKNLKLYDLELLYTNNAHTKNPWIVTSWKATAPCLMAMQPSNVAAISYPESFLLRMLDGYEGPGKDRFLGDPDWSSEM